MESLTISTISSFVLYCVVQGITPGPANLCSLSVAMRYGVSVAFRQWVGLLVGFIVVAFVSIVIVRGAQERFADILPAFAVFGAVYVVWLAYKTMCPSSKVHEGCGREPSAVSGFIIQLTNVKILLMCLTALTTYVIPYTQSIEVLLMFGLLMSIIGLGCNMTWIIAGSRLCVLYKKHGRVIDTAMGIALLFCAISMFASYIKF